MKSFLICFLLILTSSSYLASQIGVVPTSLDQINDNRLMYKKSSLSQEDVSFITDSIGMTEVYSTNYGDIVIYKVPSWPVTYNNVDMTNIIEVNTTVRDETDEPGEEEGLERNNYDFKSILTAPNSSGNTSNPITEYCANYDYRQRPNRTKIKVGVFDTGINNDFEVAYNPINVLLENTFLNEQIDNNSAIDDNNHGTHIAHIVQAISGSAYNNNVEYLDYKILDGEGRGYMADLIIAIDQAISTHNVNILNLSLSTVSEHPNYFIDKFFKDLESENVLIVTSAGNDSAEIHKNGLGLNYEPSNLINVGSLDCENQISDFSNFGQIVSVYLDGEDINSYNRFGATLEYSGTSQATAILSGMAASLASHQDNFDAQLLKCAIMSSVGEQNMGQYTPTVNAPLAFENLESGCFFTGNAGLNGNNNTANSVISDYSIYPNPASDNITITLPKGEYTIILNDLLGRSIITKNVITYSTNHKEDLRIANKCNPGLHTVSIINIETKEVITKKVFINN